MKIGRLAEETGLTQRTLRWYDEIGLLTPSQRTEAGHRVYSAEDIERLHQIITLRSLGFTLDEIASSLKDPFFDHYTAVRMHRMRSERELKQTEELHARLLRIEESLRGGRQISTRDFIKSIESSIMIEKHYSEEDLKKLAERAEEVGRERMEEVAKEWETLIAEVRAQIDAGAKPTDEAITPLAERWRALITEFTGNDASITSSLKGMYEEEGPESASRGMVDRKVMEFMGRVMGS